MLALAAFLPIAVGTGYITGWFTNLHGFRRRSLVERISWSIPLSFAVSPVASFLIGRVFSLTVVVVFFEACAFIWLGTLVWEWLRLRRDGTKWIVGWQPLGNKALIWAIVLTVFAILSLIDFQHGHQLFMSLTIYDHGSRVSWTESILRTGIPPDNPLYRYGHTALMRNYYFWYILCAAVVQIAHVSARTALIAGCVWTGFDLAAIFGLYLKYFLSSGPRLRRQVLTTVLLLGISGLDILVHGYGILYKQVSLFAHPRAWVVGQIDSWFVTLLFAPHHVVGLICCMFAFLLAWMAAKGESRRTVITILVIAFALASSFGLSIYVAFAFFLLMLAWGTWQVAFVHAFRSSLILLAGGLGAAVLVTPFLWTVGHSPSAIHGSAPFGFSVRETVPSEVLLSTRIFQDLASSHPSVARNLAKLLLLPAGIAVELGFFLAVFVLYLVPRFRNRVPLNLAQRSLVFIAAASLILTSFVRSSVISYNDFGFRGSLFAQFSLLLLASEVITRWRSSQRSQTAATDRAGLALAGPPWLQPIIGIALIFGALTTTYYAIMFRVTIPLIEVLREKKIHNSVDANLSHDVYISWVGYTHLDAATPRDAVVQFNPSLPNEFWALANLVSVNRQVAIAGAKPWCGSELGGDPQGCMVMGPPIAGLFNDANAEQARSVCHQFGIQFLVATIYDPVWNDKQSWVWTLTPVVQDHEFRALDCQHGVQ